MYICIFIMYKKNHMNLNCDKKKRGRFLCPIFFIIVDSNTSVRPYNPYACEGCCSLTPPPPPPLPSCHSPTQTTHKYTLINMHTT